MRPQLYPASDPTGFMYNAIQPLGGADAGVGDTAVFGFRTQIYRANGARLAVVAGCARSAPRVVGVYDRTGTPLPESAHRIDQSRLTEPKGAR
jgi:hypothetical protein